MKHIAKSFINLAAGLFGPHAVSFGGRALWVLMYHRVLPLADPRAHMEEPGMIVTPETFRQHIQLLKTLFEVMPLSEWIKCRQSNLPLHSRACAITFDDGWLDNFEFALPILQQEQVPATLFAVSHMIGTNGQFWPNRVSRLISSRDNWQRIEPLHWIRDFGGTDAQGPMDNDKLSGIIAKLKALPDSELKGRLDAAERALGIAPESRPALMNWDQLRQMQNTGLVEIGSHTCHHFRLNEALPPDQTKREIVDSKIMLEEQLGHPVKLFCYPNGDASPLAIDLVKKHYDAAVTTQRGINTARIDPHQLLRIGVHQDISDTGIKFRARLSGWL